MRGFGAMQSEILVLPSQLAFESISRRHFSIAPNFQWAWAMIRGYALHAPTDLRR